MINVTIRNFQPDDLPALLQLINEADLVDNAGNSTTVDALSHRLAEPGIEPTKNLFVAESGDRLLGYVLLWSRPEGESHRIRVGGIVHPRWRRQGVGTALMQHAEQQAGALHSGKPLLLQMSARERIAGAAELAMSRGFQPVRYFFYMQCHDLVHLPEAVFPPGIRVRGFVLGQDEEALVQADNDGFSDHWGFVPITVEQLRHWIHLPGVRTEDWLLAVDAQERVAGFCLLYFPQMDAEMLAANPPLIDDLAVTHAYRRRGLGRALLLSGMRRIHARGFSTAALGVDADNPNQALRLYESAGFVLVSRSTVYRKELATAQEGLR